MTDDPRPTKSVTKAQYDVLRTVAENPNAFAALWDRGFITQRGASVSGHQALKTWRDASIVQADK